MANTVNAAADKGDLKTGPEKVNEKVAEKRRALGRGLESLLPGPRVVSAPPTQTAAVALPSQNSRDAGQPAAESVPAVRASSPASPASGPAVSASGVAIPASVPARPAPVAATGPTSVPISPAPTPPATVPSTTSSASTPSVVIPSTPVGNVAGASAVPPRLAPKDGTNLGHSPAEEWRAEPAPEGSSSARVLALVEAAAGEKVEAEKKEPGILPQLQAAASDGPAKATGELKLELPIELIDSNPHQTRRDFAEEFMRELAASIYVQGVLQPIVVRPGKEGRYFLVLGERRLRASRMAQKTTIPAIVKRLSDQQAAEMTLVENLQREDLDCLEQAAAFARLSENFHLTQGQIASRVGASRETVSNYMRLLYLPISVLTAISKGYLSYSHARALMALESEKEIEHYAQKAIKEKLSVWALEDLISQVNWDKLQKNPADPVKGRGARWVDPNVRAAQRSIETVLGMKVRIRDRRGKGKITIEYGSLEDFDRVVTMLKGKVRSQ